MTQLRYDRDAERDDVTDTRSLKDAEAELAHRLGELRDWPGMPQATDEAVLAMSLPRTYTACSNPFGADLVSSADDQARDPRGPFAADVSVGKGHIIYKGHGYPTKVPHEAIMRFILHYTEPGDLVLDGFAGSGMTGVAAQACGAADESTRRTIETEMGPVRWGARKAFLQDLGPSATFISAGLNLRVDGDRFERRAKEILEAFDLDWGWMYQTTTPDGEPASIDYTVWSQLFACPHCGGEVVFFDAAFDQAAKRVLEDFACGSCGASLTKSRLARRKTAVRTLAGDTIERVEFRPVALAWRTTSATGMKELNPDDYEVLRQVATERPGWFPTDRLPLEEMTEASRIGPLGISRVHHLWSDRAIAALAALWGMANAEHDPLIRLALKFWIEQAMWGFAWMNRYVPTHYSHVNQFMSGALYIPSLHAEPSPRYNLEGTSPRRGKLATLAKMWRASPARDGQVRISTGSSTRIPLNDNSVDYVFVDPPFGRNFQYSDLAMVIEAWHQVLTDPAEEAVLDAKRHKRLPEYFELMRDCFAEFERVLKPGRWMTVEFSNSSNAVWLAIQQALESAGFVVADTRIIDKEQLSYRQVSATNAVKRDLVISAYKPAAETEERVRLAAGSEDGVWAFLREYLAHLPVGDKRDGQLMVVRERRLDRLFDRMVAYHVARGITVPVSASEFSAGAERRFIVRDSMLFLPEQAEKYERMRLTYKELAQQVLFVTNESSAVQWLRQRLKGRPATFAEIQPDYFRETQSGAAAWEALPDLRVLLDENFVQDDRGRWMVPDPKKAEHLEQLRTRALLREFAEYSKGRGALERFRLEAVRAGFKEAWDKRDFAIIAHVGARVPEDAFVEDPALLHYYRNAERLAGDR